MWHKIVSLDTIAIVKIYTYFCLEIPDNTAKIILIHENVRKHISLFITSLFYYLWTKQRDEYSR